MQRRVRRQLRRLLCGVITLWLAAGCSGEYRVRLVYPDDTAWQRAVAVELIVVEGDRCTSLVKGDRPDDLEMIAAREFDAAAGPALGRLRYGTLSFFARVRDGDCLAFVEGCRTQEVRPRESATVLVLLEPRPEHGCAVGEQCSAGRCIPSDGGASDASPGDLGGRDVIREAGADAALDAGRDAARDASVDAAAMPDAAMRDVALPDAAIVDAAIVDAAIADAAIADATTADTVQPDAAMPDAGQADAWLPPPPTWIPITGGTYEMGCSPNDTDCDSDESPRHSVTISAFEMTATEITQEQYQAVTGSNPSDHTGCPTCPVESVTWQNARDFCAAVGGRLPSEAEWEYAARAGTTTKYYCGDDAACLDGIAWYNDIETMWTHPVGQKTPNAFDLYDMLGNVYEWNADWYGWSYYASSPLQDPTGPATGTDRVLRGGSYPYSDRVLRASHRFGDTPDRKLNDIGFRCAR